MPDLVIELDVQMVMNYDQYKLHHAQNEGWIQCDEQRRLMFD